MLITGTPIPGSWWAHPEAHAIYSAIRRLDSHADVVRTRLVSGKITYVHRRLWGALLAAARSREMWRLGGLSSEARALLEMVTKKGVVQTDRLRRRGPSATSIGEAARELETRLLVHSSEIHTQKGFHAKRLETWNRWARRAGFLGPRTTPARGRHRLEAAVQESLQQPHSQIRLPWYAGAEKGARYRRGRLRR